MREPSTRKRFGWLIVAHLVLASGPALAFLFTADYRLLPLLWAVCAMPFGGLMTLSVWLGMGRARVAWRLLTSIVAVAYVAIWMTVGETLQSSWAGGVSDLASSYLWVFVPFSAVVVVFGCMFMLLGRWFTISRIVPQDFQVPHEAFRFSLLHVLVLMSLVAVILTLLHAVRGSTLDENASSVLGWTADDSLGLIIFFLNTGCAVYATLWLTNVKRNIGLVMLVSALLGVVIAFATGNDQSSWWLFVGGMFIAIIPTAIVLVSLLVVRSCGFRLVHRASEGLATAS